MPTMQYLNPWLVDYDYELSAAVISNGIQGGIREQRKVNHRVSIVANARRYLQGNQLAYFEHFIREVCTDGSIKFTDAYADYNGVTNGLIRIINGEYFVRTDRVRHTVECQIEIFR